MKLKELETEERKVFTLHLFYSILEGIIFGIIILNEFVFVKSLSGTEMQLGVLLQFSMVVFLFTLMIYEILKKFKKSNILRFTALITRLPLFAFAFFPTTPSSGSELAWLHTIFLVIFFFYYMSLPVINPIINNILKNNYNPSHFGTLYSYAATVNKIIMMITTFLFGLLLDYDNFAFTYIYPIMGALGLISLFLLSKAIKVEYMEPGEQNTSLLDSIKSSFSQMIHIVKHNKAYRDFEIGFFLYGFAFMITVPIITLFLAEGLNLNYTSIAFYKNSYNLIAIALLPFFGKLLDKIDPRKFAAFTFLTLLMYLFFMGLTEYFPYYFDVGNYRFYYMLLLSFAWNGIFAATMSLLWNIGSAYFCERHEAGKYQSVHLTLVGARGTIAPLFGVWLYQFIGFSGVFTIGIVFLTAAILVVMKSMKIVK